MKHNDAFLKSTYNRYLAATMLCILGGTVNVFLDGILIGNRLGEKGLLAVNLCLPIYLVFCMLGSLIASGAAMLSAQEIGRNNLEKSRRIFGSALILAFIFAMVFSVLGIVLINPITKLLCSGTDSEWVRSYALIIISGGVPKVLLYIPFFYLRLDGKNGQLTAVMILMTILNIILDILFLYCFDMGITGAAYANIAATLIACIIGYYFIFEKGCSFTFPIIASKTSTILRILRTGTPSALNNLASALRILVINIILLSIVGSSKYVVIFSVITAVSEFSLFIINGTPQTAVPIISVYSAEKSNIVIRLLMKRQIITGTIAISVFGALLVMFHSVISGIYGISQNILIPLICLSSSLILGQVNSIMTHYFNSMEHIFLADILTILRILIMPVAVALLLTATNFASIWLFLPLSELTTILVWLGTVLIISNRKKRLSRILLLDDTLENSGRAVDFSVKSDPAEICYASKCITEFCEDNNMTPKQTMCISLAIEEIMAIMAEKSIGSTEGTFDVRAFSVCETIGLRIRCAGVRFNPVSLCDAAEGSEADENLMGIKMISGMAKKLQYTSTFGVNNFFVLIQ